MCDIKSSIADLYDYFTEEIEKKRNEYEEIKKKALKRDFDNEIKSLDEIVIAFGAFGGMAKKRGAWYGKVVVAPVEKKKREVIKEKQDLDQRFTDIPNEISDLERARAEIKKHMPG